MIIHIPSTLSSCFPVDSEKLPPHWAAMSKDEHYVRVDLKASDQEYQDVAANFTNSGLTVKKVSQYSLSVSHAAAQNASKMDLLHNRPPFQASKNMVTGSEVHLYSRV